MSALALPPSSLDDVLGSELAGLVRDMVRAAQRRARAQGATDQELLRLGVDAGQMWCGALLDGETLFDLGPVNPVTGEAPRGWKRDPRLPDPDEASARHVREHMKRAAQEARKARLRPQATTVRAEDLAQRIRQLTLEGGS